MRQNIKFIIFLILVIIGFGIFLINIPDMINENKNEFENTELEEIETAKIMQTTKFKTISSDIANSLNSIKVSDLTYINYIVNLTVSNKINSDSNSIGQEIVISYLKNNEKIANDISYHFIENILDKYDDPPQRKWRNHLLLLKYENKSFTLYNQSNLLISPQNAEIIENASTFVKINEFQKYTFAFENGSSKEIDVNLLTGDGKETLREFIDPLTGKPSDDVAAIETELIESEKEYELLFYIFK